MEALISILIVIIRVIGVATILYYVPYLLRRGWLEGENDVNPKKKKVCDICFRDIKKVSDLIKDSKK